MPVLSSEYLINELFKLLVGESILKLAERGGQPPIVPFVILTVFHTEEVSKKEELSTSSLIFISAQARPP